MASFDEVIPPGQVGHVKATLKTDHGRGVQSKVVTVTTNDADLPVMNVTLRANVVGSVTVLPSELLQIMPFRSNMRPARALVRKEDSETGTLEIKDLAVSAPWLKPKARRVDSPEPPADGFPAAVPGDWIVEVEPAGELEPGVRTERLTFATGLTREPTVTLQVFVNVPAPITLNPADLVLNEAGPDGKGAAGSTLVALRQGLDSATLQVTAEPEEFRVAMEPANSQLLRARVVWTPRGASSPTSGKVTFRAGASSVVLPVRVNLNLPNLAPAPSSAP